MQEASSGRRVSHPETVLIVESVEFTRRRLGNALAGQHCEIRLASTIAEGQALVRSFKPDLILVGLDLAELPGPQAIEVFVKGGAGAAVIAVGTEASLQAAVAAGRHNAVDYVTDQEAPEELVARVQAAARAARRSRELRARPRDRAQDHMRRVLLQHPGMVEVFSQVRRIGPTEATALLVAEPGTGKRMLAREIHERSSRQTKLFVTVDCGVPSPERLEREVFGAVARGGEGPVEGALDMTRGGTLFVDEIDKSSPGFQLQLLRAIDDRVFQRVGARELVPADTRIVAATSVDLRPLVDQGRFRKDLYYRLNTFPIRLPALRARLDELPLLMRHFIDHLADQHRCPRVASVAPEVLDWAMSYHWPGNLRELRSLCERWALAHAGEEVGLDALPEDLLGHEPALRPGAAAGGSGAAELRIDDSVPLRDNVGRVVEEIERSYLERVLDRCGGHLGHTAAASGITRRTLYTKMRQYDLDARDYRRQSGAGGD